MSVDEVLLALSCRCKRLWLRMKFKSHLKLGKGVVFRRRFVVNINRSEPADLSIGSNCFFNNDCSINCRQKITIGKRCLFGEGVKLYDHNHVFSSCEEPIINQGFDTSPIAIGDNCWFGSGVVVLAGTTVGDNTVVGAGAVISGELPSNSVVISRRELVYRPREGGEWCSVD